MGKLKSLGVVVTAVITLALATSALAASPLTVATGQVVKGASTYPAAVITYDQALDASDAGSNPGIEVWPTLADATNKTNRLFRSNDNNGQWDYQVEGGYFSNGQAVIFGTKTGSHGPIGTIWKSPSSGWALSQHPATVDCAADTLEDGRALYGPFVVVKGSTYAEAYVTYDPALDATDAGSNPGIEVWPTLADATARTNRLFRSNDNNGQWDYQVSCAYAGDGVVNIVGARSPNGGQSWAPRIWVTVGGSFLTQYAGI